VSSDKNLQVRLASRPQGWVRPENFDISTAEMPSPAEGELLIRNIYLSLDPYMRPRMNDQESYVPPFVVGEVLEGGVVGEVIASRRPDYAVGDIVIGMLGWEQFSLSNGEGLMKAPFTDVPLSHYLGVLGMPGLTAYVGLMKIGRPRAGETVFVSAASGAVGSVVGQLARIEGCFVAGSAGSDAKVACLLDDLGFDAAFNYKTEDIGAGLRRVCPDGIDIDFENVGGAMLEQVIARMNDFGRIVFCGAISAYNQERPEPGPRNLFQLIAKRIRMEGFIVSDHYGDFPDYVAKARGWLADGRLKALETIVDGLETAPQALIGLFKGENFGKLIVRIGPEPGH